MLIYDAKIYTNFLLAYSENLGKKKFATESPVNHLSQGSSPLRNNVTNKKKPGYYPAFFDFG